MKYFTFLISNILLCQSIFAQSLPTDDIALGSKLWGNTSLRWQFNEKFSVFVEPMFGYNFSKKRLEFIQSDLKLDYKPLYDRQIDLTIGLSYKPIFIIGSTTTKRYDRPCVEVVYRHKILNQQLKLKHTLFVDAFFPNLPKYRYRFCYGLNVYSPIDLKIDKLALKPFIKGEIYYYLGGDPVSYYSYDANNNPLLLAKNSPNDFHRFRFLAGFTTKPCSFMRINMYYLYQREFNTPFTTNRGLNVLSKGQGFYKIPFNNFHTIGFEIEFVVKKKKQQEFESESDYNDVYPPLDK